MNVYITKLNGPDSKNQSQYMQWMTTEIAHRLGYREMGIYRYDGSAESVDSLNARLDGIIAGIQWGEDVVICQFPTGNGFKFEWELVNRIRCYQCRVVIFVHDSESIVRDSNQTALPETIRLYNQAEVLIIPSLMMRQFLLDNGIRKDMKFIIQEMWDYPMEMSWNHSPEFIREIHYIGSRFTEIEDWDYEMPLKVYTFSPEQGQKVYYMGKLSQGEQISALSKGGFGLIWFQDANSRRGMEYDNSFELSRYLAAGIPVIVPAGISNQTLIEKNHLGLVVNSIEEAVTAAEAVTEKEYQRYARDVKQFASAIREGRYTQKCLIDSIHAINRKDAGYITAPAKIYNLGEHKFTYTVLKESYKGYLALSWCYQGEADGFLIYDTLGKLIYETRNIYQHYFRIKGYGKESGFIVKAYVDTLKGKLSIEESRATYLQKEQYEFPKVSMIIPAFNAENYIVRSVDVVLAQSFTDLEIIIVDDGSTDGTADMLKWYAEEYSNVIVIHQENGGVASARNTGIKRAGGEYIGFMDNDDMIYPEMIKNLYDSARVNDCDIVVTSVYQIRDGGHEMYIQYQMQEDVAMTVEDFFKIHFDWGRMIAAEVWNKLYRSSLVKEYLFPVMQGDDCAWTPYVLSYANRICYRKDCYYEWDRSIRKSTLVDEWISKPRDEMLKFYKDTVVFYLENGNPGRMGILKEQAKRLLLQLSGMYGDDEYTKLWEQIEEKY